MIAVSSDADDTREWSVPLAAPTPLIAAKNARLLRDLANGIGVRSIFLTDAQQQVLRRFIREQDSK